MRHETWTVEAGGHLQMSTERRKLESVMLLTCKLRLKRDALMCKKWINSLTIRKNTHQLQVTKKKEKEKKEQKKEKEFYKNNSDPTASLIQPLWHKYVNSVLEIAYK